LVSPSHSQEIPRLLWNPEIHYRVHNSPPLDTMQIQFNSIHILTHSSLLLLDHPAGLIPSLKFCIPFLFLPFIGCCMAHVSRPLDLNTVVKRTKFLSPYALYSFLYCFSLWSIFSPQKRTLNLYASLMVRYRLLHP